MNEDRPLLTIAIPTYNRASLLRDLLFCLANLPLREHPIEIIISDNASTDETPQVVQESSENGLRFQYVRNENNIGPDANFLQCFRIARGRYVWIFGDDDSIDRVGFITLINHLESEVQFDLVYMAPHEPESQDAQGIIPKGQSRIVEDPKSFANLVNSVGDFIFISTVIINKDRVDRRVLDECRDMIGTQVLQLTWAFTALSHLKRGLFLKDRIVLAGRDLPRGNFDAGRVFIVNYTKAVRRWLKGNGSLQDGLMSDLMVFWFSHWVSLRRLSGRVSTANTGEIKAQLSSYGLKYYLFVAPLMSLPLPLAQIWMRCLGVLRRIIRERRMAAL